MKIQEITEKFGNLKIFEKRCINDAYAEIVFFTEQLDHWRKILEDSLGPAVKPSGLEPSKNHKKVADAFGGIFFNRDVLALAKREAGDVKDCSNKKKKIMTAGASRPLSLRKQQRI